MKKKQKLFRVSNLILIKNYIIDKQKRKKLEGK